MSASGSVQLNPPGSQAEENSIFEKAPSVAEVQTVEVFAKVLNIDVRKQPILMSFEMPFCAPAKVHVNALFGKLKDKNDCRVPNADLNQQLIYTGFIGCCSKTMFWPELAVVPTDQRGNDASVSKSSFMVSFFYGPMKLLYGHSVSVDSAMLGTDVYRELLDIRTELNRDEVKYVAVERFGEGGQRSRQEFSEQFKIATVVDPVFFENIDPTRQCCMQKQLSYAIVHTDFTKQHVYTVKTKDVPKERWGGIVPSSSRCCTEGQLCSCDCFGCCGEMRSLKFRCMCSGDFTHKYPVYDATDKKGRTPPITDIIVRGSKDWLGRARSSNLTVTIDPPKNTTPNGMKVLLALGMELAITYMKPF